MVHILGLPEVVKYTTRSGVTTRYWVSRGVLHWEDSKGDSGSFSDYWQARYHLACVRVMIGISSQRGIDIDVDERIKMNRFVLEMEGLLKKMHDDGTPVDRLRDAKILQPQQMTQRDIANEPRIKEARKKVMVSSKFFD